VAVEKKAYTPHPYLVHRREYTHLHTHAHAGKDTRAIDKYTSREREIFFLIEDREREIKEHLLFFFFFFFPIWIKRPRYCGLTHKKEHI